MRLIIVLLATVVLAGCSASEVRMNMRDYSIVLVEEAPRIVKKVRKRRAKRRPKRVARAPAKTVTWPKKPEPVPEVRNCELPEPFPSAQVGGDIVDFVKQAKRAHTKTADRLLKCSKQAG